jgi:hypothetical protein
VTDLTSEERNAIAALERLAKRWPQTLKLISMDGNLHIVRAGDPRADLQFGSAMGQERQEAIIADIEGIPNDGGSW